MRNYAIKENAHFPSGLGQVQITEGVQPSLSVVHRGRIEHIRPNDLLKFPNEPHVECYAGLLIARENFRCHYDCSRVFLVHHVEARTAALTN
jgi:hypothetical protein